MVLSLDAGEKTSLEHSPNPVSRTEGVRVEIKQS